MPSFSYFNSKGNFLFFFLLLLLIYNFVSDVDPLQRDWNKLKTIVRKALAKGLEEELIIRPKDSVDMTGLNGRFMVSVVNDKN